MFVILLTIFKIILFILTAIYGAGLAFILYDEYLADAPKWMIKYLAWLLPDQGWEEELEEE